MICTQSSVEIVRKEAKKGFLIYTKRIEISLLTYHKKITELTKPKRKILNNYTTHKQILIIKERGDTQINVSIQLC